MIQFNGKSFTSPADITLGVIGGKWKIHILFLLFCSNGRSYTEIKKNLPGVSEKMLSQQLRELERDRLIGKRILSPKPYRVNYFLTEKGGTIMPLCTVISRWGADHLLEYGIAPSTPHS